MRRKRRFGLRLLTTTAAMAGVALVAACDGENLFSVAGSGVGTQGDDTEAPTVKVNSPRGDSLSAKPIGDSVFVSAQVTDDVGVRTVRFAGIAQRGDKNLGTDEVIPRFEEKIVTLEDVKDTTLTRYLIPTADDVKETVQILVEATDTAGNVSADTVDLILGGPDVQLLDIEDGQSVQAGLNLSTRVTAEDPLGIIQIRIDVTGAFTASAVKAVTPPADSVGLDTVIAIPAGISGEIQVSASARNNLDVSGGAGPITLQVIAAGVGDTIAPRLKHASSAPERMELQDVVTVEVTGGDDSQGGGLSVLGYTVHAISATRGDTITRSDSVTFSPPRTGTVTRAFNFDVFNVDSLGLPDTLVFEVTSWARDSDGNCGSSIGVDSLVALACSTNGAGQTLAENRTGERVTRAIVAGKTVLLPNAGQIMDAVVDTFRQTMLLSNIDRDRIEVFDLSQEQFQPSVPVGAAPWGLTLNNCYAANITANCGDTLIVANSGGTNLSMVYLGPKTSLGGGGEFEDPTRRLLTPDMLIFNARIVETEQGDEWLVEALNEFSDRPQFVQIDEARQFHYSTWPTTVRSGRGTLRRAYVPGPGLMPEVVVHAFQFPGPAVADAWGLVNLDWAQWGQSVNFDIQDHVLGTTVQISENVSTDIDQAVTNLQTAGSDVVLWSNPFRVDDIGFGDTTFVAASGNGRIVLFGEGGVVEGNRILIYDARTFQTRFGLFTEDLLINKDDRISGLGVNQDGTLAMGRGTGAYFFTEDLRLQGEAQLSGGGAGAALHPLHADALSLANPGGEYRPDTHLAFMGTSSTETGTPAIEIYDTFHFFRSGRIFIRDEVVGPMRASLPFPGDNLDPAGIPFQCATQAIVDQDNLAIGDAIEIFQGGDFNNPWPADGGAGGSEDRCVVLKLYATTAAGGVVVVDVRKSDILRDHPSRN